MKDVDSILLAGGLLAIGGSLSISMRQASWIVIGGIAAGSVVGYRLYERGVERKEEELLKQEIEAVLNLEDVTDTGPVQQEVENETLGAPELVPRDTGIANGGSRFLKQSETVGFPMRHRVPECDMRTDPSDSKINWYSHGPMAFYGVNGIW